MMSWSMFGFRERQGARRALICALAFGLLLAAIGGAEAASWRGGDDQEEADVKNFGRVNEHLYRGGQPKEKEYRELTALGVRTVLDLREDAEPFARRGAERAGLKYINLPLNAKVPPTMEESNRFLQIVNDSANWPVFVHCAGGRHRTGVLVAVYRMEHDGWTAEQAYREMKDFKFYSRFGYGDMKDYVFDYYRRMAERRPATRSRRVASDR